MRTQRVWVAQRTLRVRRAAVSQLGNHGGAPRRVNFDNPPLKGSCEVSLGILRTVSDIEPLTRSRDTCGYSGIPKYPCAR